MLRSVQPSKLAARRNSQRAVRSQIPPAKRCLQRAGRRANPCPNATTRPFSRGGLIEASVTDTSIWFLQTFTYPCNVATSVPPQRGRLLRLLLLTVANGPRSDPGWQTAETLRLPCGYRSPSCPSPTRSFTSRRRSKRSGIEGRVQGNPDEPPGRFSAVQSAHDRDADRVVAVRFRTADVTHQ